MTVGRKWRRFNRPFLAVRPLPKDRHRRLWTR